MNDHRVALITDSTCDIPGALVDRHEIIVVPMHLIWGDKTFRDRVDMAPETFYHRLTEDAEYPTTAHPTPEGFLATYEKAIRAGAEEIVVIAISSEQSGAFQSASQAGTMIDPPVHVFDSKSNTMGLGWQVLAAARARERGANASAMIEAADGVRQHLAHYVFLDTMEYLHKGGRIGGATRLIGSLLDIKPLVYVDRETGRVEAAGRVRSRRRGLETLYKRFFDQLDARKRMHIAVMHGDAPEDAQEIANRIEEEYSPEELLVGITGPVLGVHTGPGAIALCGYTD
ncbi:MAG: DegV family protein [Anaerolineae bacterium]